MEDHHRAMVDGQPPEAALQLVAIDDRAEALSIRRLINRQKKEVRRPAARSASLGVAGTHEEPVRPGIEAGRVAKLRKVPPDGQQRLLRRILGKVGVAQDPVRHRVETVADGDGEAREGLLVSALRPSDQLGIHVTSAVWAPGRSGRLHGMGAVQVRATQSSGGLGIRDRLAGGPPGGLPRCWAPIPIDPADDSSGAGDRRGQPRS